MVSELKMSKFGGTVEDPNGKVKKIKVKGPSLIKKADEVAASVKFKRRVSVKQLYIKTACKNLPVVKTKALPKNIMLDVIFDTTEASSSVRAKTTNSAGKSSKVSSAVNDGTE